MVATASSPAGLPDAGRYVALDSWRGLAALGVVAVHLHGGGPLFDSRFARSGGTWVDFFFVLSGFVIASSYGARLAEGFSIRRFALLRLGRIWPLHACVVLFYVAVEFARLLFPGGVLSGREVFAGPYSLGMLVPTLLLVQFWLPWFNSYWNHPSWSISVEWLLYLLMAAAWRGLGARGWQLAFAAALLAGVAIEFGSEIPVNIWLVARGVAGFGFGVVVFRWRDWGDRIAGNAAEIACVVAVVAIFATPLIDAFPLALIDLVFAALVAVFAVERGIVSALLRRRPFVFLGSVSYSLYLTHNPVIGRQLDLLRWFGLSTLRQMPDGLQHVIFAPSPWNSAIGVAIICLCLPAAWLSWRFIEMPAREWSRRRAARFGAAAAETAAPTM